MYNVLRRSLPQVWKSKTASDEEAVFGYVASNNLRS